MIKASMRAAAVAAGLMVSACGGGGGSAGFIPPPPTQSAEAFPLTKSATFQTSAAHLSYIKYDIGRPTITDFGVSGKPSGVTFTFDAANDTYTVADGTKTATFDLGSRTSNGSIDSYVTQSGSVTDQLDVSTNLRGGSGSGVHLTYLSFGTWAHKESDTENERFTHFLFGYPTAPADMPRTGSASYDTAVSATYLESPFAVPINASATFSANFASGTVNTSLSITDFITVQGTGNISGSEFSGNFSGEAVNTITDGSFAGGFFGPGAAEMGYAFKLHFSKMDPGAGAAGLADPYFVGTVVGTKH
jgi:hypothetical protein